MYIDYYHNVESTRALISLDKYPFIFSTWLHYRSEQAILESLTCTRDVAKRGPFNRETVDGSLYNQERETPGPGKKQKHDATIAFIGKNDKIEYFSPGDQS